MTVQPNDPLDVQIRHHLAVALEAVIARLDAMDQAILNSQIQTIPDDRYK